MKKYIDADKLIAEIEMWRDKAKEDYNESTYSMGRCDALAEFRNHIVSLQQEQPKESEDERIRKAISAAICGTTAETVLEANGVKLVDALSYLEKQKEQKPSTPEDIAAAYQMGLSEGRKEQQPAEWSGNFEENIRELLHDKLTWHSEDGSMSSAVFIDDKTLKDIISGIWFYVGKEALKYPNKKKYIDAEKLIAEIKLLIKANKELKSSRFTEGIAAGYGDVLSAITSLQQEQSEVDLEKLVNEEFAGHSRTTEYGLEVTYNRAELYQFIKRMALVFNARNEEKNGKNNTAL